jgi:hypothetical protein
MNEADEIVKLRAGEYGEPKRFFKAYEAICNEMDGYKASSPYRVDGCRIVLQMLALKLLRLVYNPAHKDSIKDLKGYTKILEDLGNDSKTK